MRAPYIRLCQPTLTKQRLLAEAGGNLSQLIHHFNRTATWRGLRNKPSGGENDAAVTRTGILQEIMETIAAPAIQELDLVPKD